MANDPDQPLAFLETELTSYRIENDLLARELALTRRTIHTLSFSAADNIANPLLKPIQVPRLLVTGDDVYYSLDRCESGEKLLYLSGWAFSPRIDCTLSSITIILDGPDGAYIVQPRRVLRPDVAAAHALTDFGAALPLNSPARSGLSQCGFEGHVSKSGLGKGLSYGISIQIDGPKFSARQTTASSLHG